jgi:tetratricopeptide (TPR) repeat protein
MGESVGYDPVLARLAPRITGDTTNDWKVLALAMKRAKGDFAGAIADGERMLADPSNGKDAPQRRIPILRALADVYQNQTPPDFQRAKDRYMELLRYDPNDMLSLNNLAYILAELSQPADPQSAKKWSKHAFDLTLSQNEPDPLIRDTHGWVLTLCGGNDLQEGMLILRKVVEVRPDLAEARYHLGEAYVRLNRLQDAEKELDEGRRLMESDESAGVKIDTKLRDRILTSLGNVRQALKLKPAA